MICETDYRVPSSIGCFGKRNGNLKGKRWRQDAIRSTRKEIKPGIGTDTPPPIRHIVDSTLVVNGKRANFENWNQFISGGVPSMAVFYEAEFIDRSW